MPATAMAMPTLIHQRDHTCVNARASRPLRAADSGAGIAGTGSGVCGGSIVLASVKLSPHRCGIGCGRQTARPMGQRTPRAPAIDRTKGPYLASLGLAHAR